MKTAGASRSAARTPWRLIAFSALLAGFAPVCLLHAQSDPITAADAAGLGVLDSDETSPAASPAPAPSAPARSAPSAPAAGTAPPATAHAPITASPVSDTSSTAPIVEASPPIAPVSKSGDGSAPIADVEKGARTSMAASPTADLPVIRNPTVPEISPGDTGTDDSAQGMQEIPQAVAKDGALASPGPSTNTDVDRYQQQTSGDAFGARGIGTLRDFVSEGEESSAIGVQLREARRKLKGGEEADGLLVVNVTRDSPAAKAGLKPYHRIAQNMLTGATIAAAMVFPPAILILPVLDYTQVGESYDMIIGVDGARVTNFIDFEERMRDVQPGQLVYLSVVRNGKRIQLEVPMPPNAPTPSY